MKKFLIGIDPGVNTGIAIYHSKGKTFFEVSTVSIAVAIDTLLQFHVDNIHVRVEDARKRTWFGSAGREQLQGAGSIKRDCQIWEEFLTHHNISFELVAPKDNRTKLDSKAFKMLTGWQKRTSNHARDAAMLVFGR